MAVVNPYGQEIGVVYKMIAPDGQEAVFNESTNAKNVGPLSAVTGLDSPEVIESYGMNVERDGGFHNNFFFGRRPFTLAGQIVGTGVGERLEKMARLEGASLAMQADGKLEWTPSSGVPVFLNFRRQQPVVTSGAWVKDFFCALVAADPRIYETLGYQQYLAVNGNIAEDNMLKFVFAAGGASVMEWPLTVVKGEQVNFETWVKVNSTWTGGKPAIKVSGVAGTEVQLFEYNLGSKGTWQRLHTVFTPTASGTGRVFLSANSVPSVGNFVEMNMPMISSLNYSGLIGSSESLGGEPFAGWTRSNTFERPPYNQFQGGNFPAPVEVVVYGPITGFKLVSTQTGEPMVVMTGGIGLAKGEKLTLNLDKRTAVISPSEKDAYGLVNFLNTNWWGVPSIAGGGETTVKLTTVTGAGTGTGAIVKWRGTWV